jgi:hypothetical protein
MQFLAKHSGIEKPFCLDCQESHARILQRFVLGSRHQKRRRSKHYQLYGNLITSYFETRIKIIKIIKIVFFFLFLSFPHQAKKAWGG